MTTSNKINSFDTPGGQRISHSSPENGKKKQRGGVLVLVAVSMTALLAVTGFALDTGMIYYKYRQAQSAADAAALAGAIEIYNGSGDVAIEKAAEEQAGLNGFEHGKEGVTVTVNYPFDSSNYVDESAVEVIVEQAYTTRFLSVLGFDVVPYSARAVAGKISHPDRTCLYVLGTKHEKALHINDSSAEITADSCGVWVNSNDSEGLYLDGKLQASTVRVAGGVKLNGGSIVCTGDEPCPNKSLGAASDPYASIPVPDVNRNICDFGKYGEPYTVETNESLNPAIYCGGIHIKEGSVTFSPGLYILRGGGLEIENEDSKVTGEGVTFYNTCYKTCTGNEDDEKDFGPLYIHNSTSATLKAPPCSSGGCIRDGEKFEGILFFTDPMAPGSEKPAADPKNEIADGSHLNFSGVMYFPNQYLAFNSESSAETSGATPSVIVSKYFELGSKSKLIFESSGSGAGGGGSSSGQVAIME